MALVTVQRSPSPTNTPESEETGEDEVDDPNNSKSPGRQRRSKSTLKRLRKFFHTVRFISKLRPCFSESYFAVKGAALILPQSDSECTYSITRKISRNGNEGDIQSHLQSMFYLLRPQDTIKVAVKLESLKGGDRNRYMAVVSTNGKQDTEESVILGIDCDEKATIGLVVPIYANTTLKLDGDGGFQIVAEGHPYGFKPVSVQAMWSALQSLNKVLKIASDNVYLVRGLTHTWIGYYKSRINSERAYITEWNTNEDIEFFRSVPIVLETDDEEAALKKQIKVELKNVMMKVDLDDVTSRYLREQVEEAMGIDLKEHRGFIDQQMLQILGQMDSPTLIKEFLYLGSEWNASNMAELQNNGVGHILNISKEIDNFFPTVFTYMNVREWDSEETNLLPYWEDTYKFITEARANDSKVLVHCKMGISRSASTVIAFCMKEYDMSRQEAYDYVKELRSCIMPNSAFWHQLETYEGILKARSEQNMQKPPSRSVPETPEEPMTFLGQNLPLFDYSHVCHSADLDESVFWHPDKRSDEDGNHNTCPLEPDFEISSRSADSTEELLPDNLSPTPDTASGMLKTASGVYYFKDPIISKEKTDSDESGEEGVDSGTDKNFLSLNVGKESTCSIEVPSLPKIKPDRSWIRESSTDDLDPGGGMENIDQSKMDSVEGAEAVDSSEEGMIYFKAHSAEVDDKSKLSDSVFLHDATVSESTTDDSPPGIDHYIKENIPWNPGKVKKQKEDLEGKMKDSKSESIDSSDGVIILVDGVPFVDQTSAEKLANKQEVVKSHDQKNGDETDQILKEIKTEKIFLGESSTGEQDPPLRRPASVYEMEDIQLPEGIVKRTTQEIEDRNKSTDDLTQSENRPLRRSSSLKDERVTPKNKRSSERRKTCTPILSPTTPSDTSPAKDISKLELESSFTRDTTPQDLPVDSQDIDNTHSNDICDNKDSFFDSDNQDLDSPATDVAVYKFLGEEVSVEKGIVKKQKMGKFTL
ncbi:hypothetical protein KUTeg_009869 [Tegillarca granosa]|uniref:protein-serine/threonine phosphatase n=1 Tax=Tegillarca granosa TaxID=220873 RepID=A0ABQ9F7F3_TEGGR|nr:hypothetical protein KUTeg_009869 [Tegillarca granosa]